jgi:hypothetical protein
MRGNLADDPFVAICFSSVWNIEFRVDAGMMNPFVGGCYEMALFVALFGGNPVGTGRICFCGF